MRLLVVGGSDAGISAALRARELDPTVEVTVVVADRFPNFSICGLPYHVSADVPDWRRLAHRSVEQLEATGMELRLDHTVHRIDPATRRVLVTAPHGHKHAVGYDRLIVGTGASRRAHRSPAWTCPACTCCTAWPTCSPSSRPSRPAGRAGR
jgi:NADPH-dependent 2,4-dienoyl-CoA reductase/sulfur reductase-like enzyme